MPLQLKLLPPQPGCTPSSPHAARPERTSGPLQTFCSTVFARFSFADMFWSLPLCVIAAFAPVPADAQSSNRFVVGCPARCDKSMCPRPPAECAAGQTLDVCNCCPVCASGEGEACGSSGKLGDPVCGEGLECSVTGGVAYTVTVRRRSKSGTCMCKSSEPVCGSDGVSYRNICELKRVSRRAQKLQQPPVLFIQRGACGKGRPGTGHRTPPRPAQRQFRTDI